MDTSRKLYRFVDEYRVLTSTPQTVATAGTYENLGSRIDCRNCNRLTVIFNLDINDAQDFRIQLLPALTDATTYLGVDCQAPVLDETHNAGLILAQQRQYEINVDTDSVYYVTFEIPVGLFWQVQVTMGTDGGTNPDVEASWYIKAFV